VHLTNWAALTGAKTTKCDIVKKLGLGAFVEDCFEMAVQIADDGTDVVLLDYPWNLSNKTPRNLEGKIHRVQSWEGIVGKVRQIAHERPGNRAGNPSENLEKRF